MAHLIVIRPSGFGWFLESDAFANALTFRSGAEAERAAQRLAERYAGAGEDAEVRVYLRDSSLAGRHCYSPSRALAS
jgi:acetylornithine/succinyldiaminopimelate/putrescine aminotransferase